MLILALQTSDRDNAVAVFDGQKCILETNYSAFLEEKFPSPAIETSKQPPGSSTLLLPMVKHVFDQLSLSATDLDLIAVTQGPGMFTPLRVGIVAARTMAYVNDIPLVGVDVLHALALAAARRHQLAGGAIVESVVNAQRKQLFAAKFGASGDGQVDRLEDSRLVLANSWAQETDGDVLLTGPGLKIVSQPAMNELLNNDSVRIESPELWNCDVFTVADIARQRFSDNDVDDPWSLEPIYFRPSAAEEVRASN